MAKTLSISTSGSQAQTRFIEDGPGFDQVEKAEAKLRALEPVTQDDTQPSRHLEAQTKGLVKRRNGRVRRKRSLYMPPDLDARLASFCHANGREVSETIAEAVALFLDKREA